MKITELRIHVNDSDFTDWRTDVLARELAHPVRPLQAAMLGLSALAIKQFDKGGAPATWFRLAAKTQLARQKKWGYYKFPSGEGPSRRIGVWTGEMMAAFGGVGSHALERVSGAKAEKGVIGMGRAFWFHRGRRGGQPARTVWPFREAEAVIEHTFKETLEIVLGMDEVQGA